MNANITLLFLLIFPVSLFARYWRFKRPDDRPPCTSNEVLQIIGAAGILCLLAACFLAFNLGHPIRSTVMLVVGLAYDLGVRHFFYRKEIYLITNATRVPREEAVERVRRRAGYRIEPRAPRAARPRVYKSDPAMLEDVS